MSLEDAKPVPLPEEWLFRTSGEARIAAEVRAGGGNHGKRPTGGRRQSDLPAERIDPERSGIDSSDLGIALRERARPGLELASALLAQDEEPDAEERRRRTDRISRILERPCNAGGSYADSPDTGSGRQRGKRDDSAA